MAKETNKGTHLYVKVITTNQDIFEVEVDNIEFDNSSVQISASQGLLDFKYEEIKEIDMGVNMNDTGKRIFFKGDVN